MELTKFGDSGDPLEGTNVTLRCHQLPVQPGIKLKWSIIKSEAKEPVALNETDLPKGLKETCKWQK